MTTMSLSLSFPFLFSLFIILSILSIVAQATVPPNKTFTFVNIGSFGEWEDEYGSNYRLLYIQRPNFLDDLNYQQRNLALCFYNTTPNAYTFGLRMGARPEGSSRNIMRWIWAANRDNPVRDNATLTFGANGNLVLADADGRVAWQTGTANKGVVAFELLPNGNVVLLDNRGRFVWQSFDYPTDTLLVGQGLRRGGPTQLISRVSDVDGSRGPYSLVLENQKLALYLKSNNSPTPLKYYTSADIASENNSVVFNSAPAQPELWFYLLTLGSSRVARLKYNSSYSFLRLESNGTLKAYTYYDNVEYDAWENTYSLFNRDGRFSSVSECKLPTRCGSLGVCSNNQCVGCPTPKGLLAWSETCAPPKLPVCQKGASIGVNYYKVVGVEHFTSEYTQGEGPAKVSECRAKCNKDCRCLAFFYKEESSNCLLAYELGTLAQVPNQSHVAYIKVSK